MCSFWVWKNAYLNYREFDLEVDLVGVPYNTTKTWLKIVGHGGYEWVENEMCRFAEDMS